LPSQSAKPAAHWAMAHAPFEHLAVALGRLQTWAHPPQFSGSVLVFTSQPSAATRLQFANGCAHIATVHAPPEHPALAFGSAQTLLQPPQLLGSVAVSTSHPFAAAMS